MLLIFQTGKMQEEKKSFWFLKLELKNACNEMSLLHIRDDI